MALRSFNVTAWMDLLSSWTGQRRVRAESLLKLKGSHCPDIRGSWMKEVVVSHVSLSFSGSGNPNCFVNVLFSFFFRPQVIHWGGTLTSLLVVGHSYPGLVIFHKAYSTSRAARQRVVPQGLRGKRTNFKCECDSKELIAAVIIFLIITCKTPPFMKWHTFKVWANSRMTVATLQGQYQSLGEKSRGNHSVIICFHCSACGKLIIYACDAALVDFLPCFPLSCTIFWSGSCFWRQGHRWRCQW